MAYKILAINPGSTSTKISVAHDIEPLFVEDVKHLRSDLEHFHTIFDQYEYRKQHILQELERRNIPLDFDAVVGRGGLAKAVESGVYRVTPEMIEDQRTAPHQHPCDLGCKLAYEIAEMIPGCQSFIADPGVVDEMAPEAHVTGLPEVPRICIWHALNQKAVARRYAREYIVRQAEPYYRSPRRRYLFCSPSAGTRHRCQQRFVGRRTLLARAYRYFAYARNRSSVLQQRTQRRANDKEDMLARRFARTLGHQRLPRNKETHRCRRRPRTAHHIGYDMERGEGDCCRRCCTLRKDRRRNPHRWYVLQRIPCWRTEKAHQLPCSRRGLPWTGRNARPHRECLGGVGRQAGSKGVLNRWSVNHHARNTQYIASLVAEMQ